MSEKKLVALSNKIDVTKMSTYTTVYAHNDKMRETLEKLFSISLASFSYDSKKHCFIDSTKKVIVSARQNEKTIAMQVNVASDFESLKNSKHHNKSEDIVIDGVTYIRVIHAWALATQIHVYIDAPAYECMQRDCEEVANTLATDFHIANNSDNLFCGYAYKLVLKAKEYDKLETLASYIDSIATSRLATYVAHKDAKEA